MAILNEDSDESESFTGPFDTDSIENLSLARVKLALKYEQKRVSSATQEFAWYSKLTAWFSINHSYKPDLSNH